MRFAVFRKSLWDLWREKTFLLVLGLIFFVILSISLLIAVTAFVYNPEYLADEDLRVGFIGNESVDGRSNKIDWVRFTEEESAFMAFDNRSIDAIVIQREGDVLLFDVILPNNPVKRSLLSALLKDTFQSMEDEILGAQTTLELISPSDIRSPSRPIRGIDRIFEILFGFALPLFLLIPTFLIGNLFIDNISEDFERKNNSVLFTAMSPLRYVNQILLFGLLINIVLVAILQTALYFRFFFLTSPYVVFVYVMLFFGVVAQLAVLIVSIFKIKTTSQLCYSFTVLTIFLISPYARELPIKVISTTMLGIETFHLTYVAWTVAANVILYAALYWYHKKEYYV